MRGRGLATGQAECRKGLPEKAAVKPDVRGQGTCPPPPPPPRRSWWVHRPLRGETGSGCASGLPGVTELNGTQTLRRNHPQSTEEKA